jgi:hypothetical protein
MRLQLARVHGLSTMNAHLHPQSTAAMAAVDGSPSRAASPTTRSTTRPKPYLLWSLILLLTQLPTPQTATALPRVALLPILRDTNADEREARRLHSWLTALIAISDAVALVPTSALDRGATTSRVATIAHQLAQNPRHTDTTQLLETLRRLASLDRLLAAHLNADTTGKRTLTLLAFDGLTLRVVQTLPIVGPIDTARPQLHDATNAWLTAVGKPLRSDFNAKHVVSVVVDPPPDQASVSAHLAPPSPNNAEIPPQSTADTALPGGDGAGGRRPMAAANATANATTATDPNNATDAPALPATPLGVGFDARTNVYIDNDGNRIVTPSVTVDAAVNEHLRIGAHGALDIMTCASIDVLSAATPHGYFQEQRQEVGGSATVALDLTRISASVVGSRENDYSSTSVALGWSDEFAQRNTTLAVGYSFTDSNVGRAHDPRFERDMNSHTLSATLTQVLTPTWVAQASVWLGVLDGFQSSVYRYVRFSNGASGPEVMPSSRVREAGVLQLRGALRSDVFVGASYRLYGDSWGLLAHTAEVNASWLPVPSVTLRLRDRLHVQRGSPYYQSVFERPKRFMSIDRELGAFYGNLVGAKASWLLTDPSAIRRLELDLKVDAMRQTFADFPWLPQRNWTVAELGVSATF